ncbi:MAG: hypothetical protein PVJ76_13330 [Gemmatimonadota bacterium]|jgi:hypothetical protein
MKRLTTLFPLVALLAACAGGPPPEPPGPPPLDPVGTYDCYLDVDGMALDAVLTITGEEGAYAGEVSSEMGSMPVSDIVIDGQQMSFVVDSPDMTVFFTVMFDGDDFSGEFDAGGMGGYVTGTKR